MIRRSITRASTTLLAAACCAVVLHRLADGRLAAPDTLSPHELARWVDERGVITTAVVAARVLALLVAAYLALVSVWTIIALLARRPRLVTPIARVSPRVVRHALGLGVATVMTLPTANAAWATSSRDLPVLVQVDPHPTSTAPSSDAPTMRWIGADPSAPSPTSSSTTSSPTTPSTTTNDNVAPTPVLAPQTWRVQPGESFWAIAAANVRAHIAEPSEQQIARYWRELIAANIDRLAVPGDPDLIFGGQELVLPSLR
jgi:hypothetical protein